MLDDTLDATLFRHTQRFEPISFLGRGAMGVVYRVRDRETGAEVALKTFAAPSAEQLYRLKGEFRVLADMTHPNLVELYELIVGDGASFFTMEFVAGGDFVQHVRVSDGVDFVRLANAAAQLVTGVSVLHAAGKLHRDVKPSNVMVSEDSRVVLLDFGLATAFGVETPQHYATAIGGTLAYMAPEVLFGAAPSAEADWYSVGAMLYEILCGQLPFAGSPLLSDRRSARPQPVKLLNPRAPAAWDEIVAHLLDPQPARRCAGVELLHQMGKSHARRAAAVTPGNIFVGRQVELARLHHAFDELERGHHGVVHVAGPSGIGKSQLIRRFLADVEGDGGGEARPALVLRGRCHPQEAIPYKAFDGLIDALSRHLVTMAESAENLQLADAGALLQLFPVLRRAPVFATAAPLSEAVEPQEARRRGFTALRELFGCLSRSARLILWIDDLQWSDLDSVPLLREVLRQPVAPQLLLLSYRSEDMGTAPLLDLLTRDEVASPTTYIALDPLDREDSASLVHLLAGLRPDVDCQVGEIVAEARGNPFLVCELVHALADGHPVPQVGDLVSDRINHLPPQARVLLELVSIAGGPLQRRVALDASGLGEGGRSLLSNLEKRSLLRTTSLHDQVAVEIYHDRIREALLELLPVEHSQARHGALADVLELADEPDAEALYRHHLGAGRRTRAGTWAVHAADRAAAALAFERAAELYRSARECDGRDAEHTRGLLTKEGDALVNATHFARAASAFQAAAATAPPREALELRRRAAEQLLAGGMIDDGLRSLSQLLRNLGLTYPRTPGRALLALLPDLLWLGVRGGRGEMAARTASEEDLLRVDTCFSAARNLLIVDTARGFYFSVQALRRAQRAGDPVRLGRSLAFVGGSLAVMGGRLFGRFGERMLQRAGAIGEQTASPLLTGTVGVVRGQVLMLQGRWREALDSCDDGVRLLSESCPGSGYECNIGRGMAQRALEELGEIDELQRRALDYLQASSATANHHGEAAASQHLSLALIARDELAQARVLARRGRELWSPRGFHLQHLYSVRQEACCDLYEGNAAKAYADVRDVWPALERSGLLRVPLVRVDTASLLARLALATAASTKEEAPIAIAENHANRLRRLDRPDARVHAALVRAGIASLRGDMQQAALQLEKAERESSCHGMVLHEAAALYRRAQLRDERLLTEANERMRRCGVKRPERWVDLYAPGGW